MASSRRRRPGGSRHEPTPEIEAASETEPVSETQSASEAPGETEASGQMASVDPRTRTVCGWELHYWTGSSWEILVPVEFPAHRCCVYRVRVETKVRRHEQAVELAGGGKGPEVPDGNDGADGTVDVGLSYGWRGLDLEARTSTARGRARGAGAPRDSDRVGADDVAAFALWSGDPESVRPDGGARLAHDEITHVSVTLEPGCVDPDNAFTATGDSSLEVASNHLCGHDVPARDCGVELAAFGWQWGEVCGDLDWVVCDVQGADRDELDQLIEVRREMDAEHRADIPAGITIRPQPTPHAHGEHDGVAYEATDIDVGTTTKRGRTWSCWVLSEVDLTARLTIPDRDHAPIDGVSSAIEQRLTHSVKVSGAMQRGDCESVGCCTGNAGHVCRCRPAFELIVDSAGSRIVVDDRSFELERDPPRADRAEPPVPADPPEYRAWRVTGLDR